MGVLLILEHEDGVIAETSCCALTAALQLTDDVSAVVASKDTGVASVAASRLKGVRRVLCAQHEAFEYENPEALAPIIAEEWMQSGRYSHLIAAATIYGKTLMPRIAALADKQQISDITEILSPSKFRRPIYAGNAIATLESLDSPIPLTIRTTAFEAQQDTDEEGEITNLPIGEGVMHGLGFVIEEKLSESERPELTSARIVISGGRGMQGKEHFAMLEKIADKIHAAVGASRAAVDAGFVTNNYQVGQTGKIVAPDLYIAVGISGAIQHLAGMKDSKIIVAINKDPEAPIFRIADYKLVADLFDALPELEKALD